MADFCKDCARLDIDGPCKWGDEYYCEKIQKYISENHLACEYLVRRPSGGYKRSGIAWYIVTKICQMLNMGIDSRLFQESLIIKEYMSTSLEGQDFLRAYDTIGPLLAKKLSQETSLYAASIAFRFLKPAIDSAKAGNLEEACAIYQNMVYEVSQELRINYKPTDEAKINSDAKLVRA